MLHVLHSFNIPQRTHERRNWESMNSDLKHLASAAAYVLFVALATQASHLGFPIWKKKLHKTIDLYITCKNSV